MRFSAATLLVLSLWAIPASEASTQSDFAGRVLDVHNAERAALNLPPLIWNDTLAEHAAAWAEHLAALGQFEHSPNADRAGEGENLWIGTAGWFTPEEMVGGWAQEKQFFRNGVFPDVSTSGGWHVVGHYTQMIWKSTTEVGCAVANGGGWDILVCRYSPPGNFVGEKAY